MCGMNVVRVGRTSLNACGKNEWDRVGCGRNARRAHRRKYKHCMGGAIRKMTRELARLGRFGVFGSIGHLGKYASSYQIVSANSNLNANAATIHWKTSITS